MFYIAKELKRLIKNQFQTSYHKYVYKNCANLNELIIEIRNLTGMYKIEVNLYVFYFQIEIEYQVQIHQRCPSPFCDGSCPPKNTQALTHFKSRQSFFSSIDLQQIEMLFIHCYTSQLKQFNYTLRDKLVAVCRLKAFIIYNTSMPVTLNIETSKTIPDVITINYITARPQKL